MMDIFVFSFCFARFSLNHSVTNGAVKWNAQRKHNSDGMKEEGVRENKRPKGEHSTVNNSYRWLIMVFHSHCRHTYAFINVDGDFIFSSSILWLLKFRRILYVINVSMIWGFIHPATMAVMSLLRYRWRFSMDIFSLILTCQGTNFYSINLLRQWFCVCVCVRPTY